MHSNVRIKHFTTAISFAASLMFHTVGAQGRFVSIDGTRQLFTPAAVSEISSVRGDFKLCLLPTAETGSVTIWSNSRIPIAVLRHGTEWAKRCLTSPAVPGDIGVRWRGAQQYEGFDVLFSQYSQNGTRLQVMETGFNLIVTINPSSGRPDEDEESLKRRILSTAFSSLQIPEGQKARATVERFKPPVKGQSAVFYGTLSCGSDAEKTSRAWWTDITVLSDGATISFMIGERTGENTPGGGAAPHGRTRYTDR